MIYKGNMNKALANAKKFNNLFINYIVCTIGAF